MTRISLQGVSKAYGATQALAGAELTLTSGTIIGIAGPNGAGKSTLTRVLAGEEPADAGTFTIDGQPWNPRGGDGHVAVVHQEPQIWPNLSVAENLMVGREPTLVGQPRPGLRENEVLDQLGLRAVAHLPAERCSLAIRQRTEIARAMVRDARCYVFDEPNSALTEDESQALFSFMHELAAADHVVVIISHRLAELVAHCDEVAIVRGGVVPTRLRGDDLDEESIAAELVVGHPTQARQDLADTPDRQDDTTLVLREWRSSTGLFDLPELTLHPRQVTAVVGVEGSGARELVASFAGFHPTSGEALREGEAVDVGKLSSFLSADRRGMLFHNLTVGDNLVSRLGAPAVATRIAGVLRSGRIAAIASDAVRRFGVKTEGPSQPIIALSGGNQQKVAIAAALVSDPVLLAVEEPTRGVDVGSKRAIYATLQRAARNGLIVVVYCTEVPEVFDLADRVLVIDRGRRVADRLTRDFPDVTAMAETIAVSEHAVPAASTSKESHT